ncbi:MAG: class I SAM-dependent methyltransferase [Planctomycetales bacterium]|nr:class I SAM-dependent methyltransferase [Planctomycetales bacterium]
MNSVAEMLRRRSGIVAVVTAPIAFLLESVSIGLMRPCDIRQMVNRTYASRPDFYHPRRYKLPYEAQLMPHLVRLRDSGRMLDAFCGQGREAELFAAAGYDITAIDTLDWMIEAAIRYQSEIGFPANFQTHSFSSFTPSEPFDIVYTSCWMYSTLQGSAQRREFLGHCRRLCRDDGLAVLSYVSNRSGSKLAASMRFLVVRATAWMTMGNRNSEPGERIYTGLFWHHLDDDSVRRETESAGWSIADAVKGNGMAPTFVILKPTGRESST